MCVCVCVFYVGVWKLTVCHSPSLMVTDEVMEAGPFPKSADIISLPPVSRRTMKSICLESVRRRMSPPWARLRTDNLNDTLSATQDRVQMKCYGTSSEDVRVCVTTKLQHELIKNTCIHPNWNPNHMPHPYLTEAPSSWRLTSSGQCWGWSWRSCDCVWMTQTEPLKAGRSAPSPTHTATHRSIISTTGEWPLTLTDHQKWAVMYVNLSVL